MKDISIPDFLTPDFSTMNYIVVQVLVESYMGYGKILERVKGVVKTLKISL